MSMRILAVSALLGLAFDASAGHSCPFCSTSGKTFSDEVKQAQVILFGTMKNAVRDPKEFGKGTTDMEIEVLIKDDGFIKEKKTITLPRYIQADAQNPTKWLVFCELYKGQLDPYRGIPVDPKSQVAEYLKGALKLSDKDPVGKLEYYFKYLDSNETDVANDALMEFGNADYKDLRVAAKKFSAKQLSAWLLDDNTQPSRLGLYGSLLGHCGDPKTYTATFQKFLADPKKKTLTGIDGIIAGFCMLNPAEGEKYLHELFRDRRQEVLRTGLFPAAIGETWNTAKFPPREEFLTRYAGLRAVRFLWTYRPDVLDKDRMVSLLAPLLYQDDIADLAMDDFRRWDRWEFTDAVLHMYHQGQFQESIVKRAIIRFALKVPNNAEAKDFIAKLRKEDAELVSSVEELLEQEKPAVAVDVKK